MAGKARIIATAFHLPDGTLTNDDLTSMYPEWSVEKIANKTGIHTRHIAGADEYSSDLAVGAATRLFATHALDAQNVDYLILCTQSPDFYLPVTAALVHQQLGLRNNAGATDINLGCSGYIYALGLAKGLIESNQASSVLVITADTYSKFLNPADKSVRTIFGDGASATLLGEGGDTEGVYGIVYGSDGSGAGNLIVPSGGIRQGSDISGRVSADARGLDSNGYDLFMDGPEIFNFTLRVVPETVAEVLARAQLSLEDIDLFVFHQANSFMLEHLRKRLGVDSEKFFVSMEETGNTVSSSIPIALTQAAERGRLTDGMKVMLLGFGVGYSWGGLIVEW